MEEVRGHPGIFKAGDEYVIIYRIARTEYRDSAQTLGEAKAVLALYRTMEQSHARESEAIWRREERRIRKREEQRTRGE